MNNLVFQEGHWVWESSGVPLTFTNWLPGEPNNFKGNQDCLLIRSFHSSRENWDDNYCDDTNMKPLCQISTGKPITTSPSAKTVLKPKKGKKG